MPTDDTDSFALVARKLGRLATLTDHDRAALLALPHRPSNYPSGAFLVREGDVPTECCILIEGYACRHKEAANGGRQIVSFHLPGDLLDLQHLQLPRADHNVQTTTRATVAWVAYDPLRALCREHPNINDALWRDALIDASIFREWVLNVGRRDAKQRIAHMLCEFAARRDAAGLGSPERFELPMTQEDIADATGLTPVHVNRMLRALVEDGVIERVSARDIQIADWGRMRRIADFDPAYLHEAA